MDDILPRMAFISRTSAKMQYTFFSNSANFSVKEILSRGAKLFCLYLTLLSFTCLAEPYKPSKNDVVAKWDTTTYSNEKTLHNVIEHLDKAQFPGQANIHHAIARSILSQLNDQQQSTSQYWYLLARSLQHQHAFDDALVALDRALEIEPDYPSAWLLKASIHLVQTNFDDAKKACTKLLGNTGLIIVATCSLEIASYTGALTQSYQQLSLILNRENTQTYSVDEALWRVQVIADMALRLGKSKAAEQWLATALQHRKLVDMPLSFITLWADIQRELGNHQNISSQLSEILEQTRFKDDALLVRLAMSEKRLNSNSDWQEQMTRRVQLRLQRQDCYHAADIARYFLYVEPSPEEALKWANINYQQAKLFDDEHLLEAAKKLNKIED